MSKAKKYKECSYCDKNSNESEIRYDKNANTFVCPKHRSHLKRYGKIINRTYRDPNEIIYFEDHVEIILYNEDRLNPVEVARTKIDIEDVEKCMKHKWHITKAGYVSTTSGKVYIHTLILGKSDGNTVDHIDRNPLNNKRDNLRFANKYQQRANVDVVKSKNSIYKGVYKKRNKWEAKLVHKGITYRLGVFEREIDGALAYDKKAKEVFGEFANLNIKEE